MKKYLLFFGLLMVIAGEALAYVAMSDSVVKQSLSLGREAWTDVCVKDRRKYYCGGKTCEATAEVHFRNFCWGYYPTAQKYAYQRKQAAKYVAVPVNQR